MTMGDTVFRGSPPPVFYDCEASGLDGMPIEIGWAWFDTEYDLLHSEAHLIRPATDWLIEDVWDPKAEALHGIGLDQLRKVGTPPHVVAARMNKALVGRELFSDSLMDENWLGQVFDEAGFEPDFIIRRTYAQVLCQRVAAERGLNGVALGNIFADAGRVSPRTHRAEADAKFWATVWRGIVKVVGR